MWRRADTRPATVQELGRIHSERISELRYYVHLLRIEEPQIAPAFYLLAHRTRHQASRNRDIAWQDPLIWVYPRRRGSRRWAAPTSRNAFPPGARLTERFLSQRSINSV